jgi:CheY-like chemotaxis protein
MIAAMQNQLPRRPRPWEKPLVMVVDDDADTLALCGKALEHAGYEARLASCGEEAISLLERRSPQLIVLDLSMPGIDGWTVAALIRKHKPTAAIPILVITGLMDNAEQAARRAGATAFCLKPFDARRLVAEVRRLCQLPGS